MELLAKEHKLYTKETQLGLSQTEQNPKNDALKGNHMTKSNTLTDTDTEESLTATIQQAKQDPIFK